jgi:hypothetical protein
MGAGSIAEMKLIVAYQSMTLDADGMRMFILHSCIFTLLGMGLPLARQKPLVLRQLQTVHQYVKMAQRMESIPSEYQYY